MSAEQNRHIRTFIYGSCVSRDTFEYLDPGRYELIEYVARQSLISAFGPPSPPAADPQGLRSDFQRRMMSRDASSQLPALVAESAGEVDLLLWDLFDERLGILEGPSGGIVTDSVELRSLRDTTDLEGSLRHVPFGSHEHFERFQVALKQWRELLERLDLLPRTILLAPAWALTAHTGESAPSSFGITPRQGNEWARQYVSTVTEQLDIPVIRLDALQTRASLDHRWGFAPFHYDDKTYSHLARSIGTQVDGQSRVNPGRSASASTQVLSRTLAREGMW